MDDNRVEAGSNNKTIRDAPDAGFPVTNSFLQNTMKESM